MNRYIPTLAACALFDGIDASQLPPLLERLRARVASFAKGDTVMIEGEAATQIGIVLSGAVQMVHNGYDGNRSLHGVIGPTQVFAEAFACARLSALPVSVVAAAPSEVLLLDGGRVADPREACDELQRRLMHNLLRGLADTTVAFHQKMDIISKRTTRDKLMTYLLRYSKQTGERSFTIPFDRQALADYLEVDRSGLSAEIGKLRREGVIACQKHHFTLLS